VVNGEAVGVGEDEIVAHALSGDGVLATEGAVGEGAAMEGEWLAGAIEVDHGGAGSGAVHPVDQKLHVGSVFGVVGATEDFLIAILAAEILNGEAAIAADTEAFVVGAEDRPAMAVLGAPCAFRAGTVFPEPCLEHRFGVAEPGNVLGAVSTTDAKKGEALPGRRAVAAGGVATLAGAVGAAIAFVGVKGGDVGDELAWRVMAHGATREGEVGGMKAGQAGEIVVPLEWFEGGAVACFLTAAGDIAVGKGRHGIGAGFVGQDEDDALVPGWEGGLDFAVRPGLCWDGEQREGEDERLGGVGEAARHGELRVADVVGQWVMSWREAARRGWVRCTIERLGIGVGNQGAPR